MLLEIEVHHSVLFLSPTSHGLGMEKAGKGREGEGVEKKGGIKSVGTHFT